MSAGVAFFHPVCKPVASLTKALPLSKYVFTVLGSSPSVQALVYRDSYLRVPYSGNPTADEAGNFRSIYLDPKIQYAVQLVDMFGVAQYPPTAYFPPCPSLGTGPIQVNPTTGEVSIGPPLPGAGDAALQLVSNGSFALACPGNANHPGQPLLQFVNCLSVGNTPTSYADVFNAPGSGQFPNVATWLPILGDGGITYYIPLWSF